MDRRQRFVAHAAAQAPDGAGAEIALTDELMHDVLVTLAVADGAVKTVLFVGEQHDTQRRRGRRPASSTTLAAAVTIPTPAPSSSAP